MATITKSKDRARAAAIKFCTDCGIISSGGTAFAALVDIIDHELRVQDRDTRHAIADAILRISKVCETPTGSSAISPDSAFEVAMNTRAV